MSIGTDTCQGDSGGPLWRWQVGIESLFIC